MGVPLITISQAAEMLGVSIQTLRRWDKTGKLPAIRKRVKGYRYYKKDNVYNFVTNSSRNLFGLAKSWAASRQGQELPSVYFCSNTSVFQTRLSRLEWDLAQVRRLSQVYPLVSAVTGEMGNNSFDHNLGNWPDQPGIFFAYDLNQGVIALADRGRGILATLRKVRPELPTHREALKTAFTEVISGRAPEYRGNGLKFVKGVIMGQEMSLFFQTGDAVLRIQKNKFDLKVKRASVPLRGCLAVIKF